MPSAPPFRRLPTPARLLLPAVWAAALAGLVAASLLLSQPPLDVALLGIAVALCLVAAGFDVRESPGASLQPGLVVLVWGSLLLPSWAIAALACALLAPSALRERPAWYTLAFNAAAYVLTGLAAGTIALALGGLGEGAHVLVLGAGAAAGVLLNHALLAAVVTASEGPGSAVRAGREGLAIDLALGSAGALLALAWAYEPWGLALAVAPMALLAQALLVPTLRRASRVDAKTGLLNHAALQDALSESLERAGRENERLAVVMVDLDRLRAVNNRFGHLSGDELILRASRLLKDAVPPEGLAARFGGEEFCLLLPGHDAARAREVADTLRAALAAERFEWEGERVSATLSAGVAVFPDDGDDAEQLVRAADLALYQAKLSGRNRVRVAVPGAAEFDSLPADALGAAPPPPPVVEPPPVAPLGPRDVATDADPHEADAEDPLVARRFRAFALALAGAALLTAAFADWGRLFADPVLLVVLLLACVALEHFKIAVFERGQISPLAVPVLALAFLVGPAGPLVVEGAIAVRALLRREPLVPVAADFGLLSLSGVAAALVFGVVGGDGLLVAAGAGAAGGMAYAGVNLPLMACGLSISRNEPLRLIWRESVGWFTPHYLGFGLAAGTTSFLCAEYGPVGLLPVAAPLALAWLAERQYVDRSRGNVEEIRRNRDELASTNEELRRLLDANRELLGTMQRSYLSTITSLARTIEAKDPYTGGHTDRVADLALTLAREMGFGADDLRAVQVGALMHDIGKIGVPDDILTKPGRLTDEEFAQMRRHPEISSYIISELELPTIVKQMVRSHHERFDGRGYPDGLTGEEIPLAARILAVADTLDAMTSNRSYRRALALDVAVGEIRANAGIQFCPRVVAAFDKCLERSPDLDGQFAPEPEAEPVAA